MRLALLFALAALLVAGVDVGPLAVPAAAAELNPLAPLSRADLPALGGRPPFTPSRRPPVEDVPVMDYATHEPTPLPSATLVGIVAAGNRTFAILSEAGTTRSLARGDALGEWTVGEIGRDSIVISDGEREETLRLFAEGVRPEGEGEGEGERPTQGRGRRDNLATATGEELLEMLRRRSR